MSSTEEPGNPFIVSTGVEKVDLKTRKLIRSHVMLGKNRGKSRYTKRKEPKYSPKSSEDKVISNEDQGKPSSRLVKTSYSTIPKRVGSDLSFIQFADKIQPSNFADLLKFTSVAKEILFPLEKCFLFDRKDKRWFEPLKFDAAYLNAVVFSTQAYIDLMLGHKSPTAGQGAILHFTKTVRLLRERLLLEDEQAKFSDSTVLVVLTLAMIAHHIGEYESANYHLEGLHKIVYLRGGLDSLRHILKLLMEILRCDIGIALHTSAGPLFFLDSTSEPFLSYPDQTLPFIPKQNSIRNLQYKPERFLNKLDANLATAWGVVERFCWMINLSAENNHRLLQEVLLHTMASVMYQLLHMGFEIGSLDEAIRLSLLAFSSSIFLQLQNVRPSYIHFSNAYKSCLLELELMEGFSCQILLWFLFIGRISIFSESENMWLKPWLRKKYRVKWSKIVE